jgi:peptidoglycan/LPS O-acetylase OafA/YrhL
LYYLLVVLGFLVLPLCVGWKHYPFNYHESSFIPRLICYLLLIPNVAYTLWPGTTVFGAIPIAHLWSIGVEEQFYLLWPALLKGLARWTLWVILAVIAIKVALHYGEAHYRQATFNWRRGSAPEKLHHFFEIIDLLRLDCMAIGGLGAYIAFHIRGVAKQIVYHPVTALLVLVAFGYVVGSEYRAANPYVEMLVVGLYAVVILCAAGNPGLSPKWIPWPLDFLGRISYGIYMYHVPVLFCLVVTLRKHHATWHTGMTIKKINHHLKYFIPAVASIWRNAALFSLVVAITIAVATISFYGFEKPFLRLKRRYTVVPSGSPDVAHV